MKSFVDFLFEAKYASKEMHHLIWNDEKENPHEFFVDAESEKAATSKMVAYLHKNGKKGTPVYIGVEKVTKGAKVI